MTRVIAGRTYVYFPVGMDRFDPCTDLKPGETVRVVNKHGCPPANTMRMCHVERLDGTFCGLVLCASLNVDTGQIAR